MSKRLDRAAREALEAAVASTEDLADEAAVHRTTLARWRIGVRGASPDAARKLADAVRRRAGRMLEAAARLEALADLEQEGGES